ncbi:hypothetical protein Tco_1537966 [Tanacetum coccineum]
MTTLAEFMIIAGADNRPPMLEKSMYDSWKSQNGTNRKKKYEELSVTEKLQANCNLKATNIVLQGLPLDVYAIVNHHKVSKEIWDRVKLLMQGTELSLQEKECKLYDKFSFVKGETLYQYYWRFAQLINNINVINMSMRPVQVNTKFLNSLLPEWSKFVTDFPNQTNIMIPQVHSPQSYSPINAAPYLSQPQISHSSVPPSQQYQSHMYHQTLSVQQIAYHSTQGSTKPMIKFPQLDSSLTVPMFQGDDPIACLNKAMTFLLAVATSRFPSTNNQL